VWLNNFEGNIDLEIVAICLRILHGNCSIGEAMKLIAHPFDGDKRKLREFIENVDVVFELVDPSKHDVLLKFVKAKITGDARSKLMVRDLTHSWELVKAILEENYATTRTTTHVRCSVPDRAKTRI